MSEPAKNQSTWPLLLSASAVLMITMGVRQSSGLFVLPLNAATGLGIVSISFALAVGQLLWGAVQPIFGAMADRWGSYRVLVLGALLLAAGLALTPLADSEWSLLLTMGVLSAAGAGAGSFSILIGATAQQLPQGRRSFAAGFINAGGSFGQFVFAPLSQAIIGAFGLTLLTHQVGGFLGAWLGGVAMAESGNYQWMWYADIALASAAALVNLPIREAKVARVPAAA
jgi:MFS family permease